MTLKELAVDHFYYASDSNYYSNEAAMYYDTWADFYDEFHDADIDLNLVYRWDISMDDDTGDYKMQITMIQQRSGIYKPIHIRKVTDSDCEQIESFLKPHFAMLVSIWEPLNFLDSVECKHPFESLKRTSEDSFKCGLCDDDLDV